MKKIMKFILNRSFSFSLLVLIFILMVWLFQSFTYVKDKEVLTVGKNGNIHYIVIPDHSNQVTKFAASELKAYLKKITGQELQVVESANNKKKEKVIQLVLDNDKSLKWDGYKINSSDKGISLESCESRGLLYAVYTLLEESGCLFFYPGEKEEFVPQRTNITFEPDTTVYNPILEHSGLTPYGLQASSADLGRKFIDWMAKNRLNYILVSEDRPSDCDGPAHGSIWKEVREELLPELQKRGFVIEMAEHCMPVFFPRSLFKDHPDWYALVNGERKMGPPPYSGSMCYSNKEAVEYYATAVAEYAVKHPEFHVIGTWGLDGGEACQCDTCKDPQTIYKAILRVAEKVRLVRPDIIVENLAAGRLRQQPPPVEKIPDNMSILWCSDPGSLDNMAREWVGKGSKAGGVYQFEYFMGDNYRARANLWLRPAYSVQAARYANEMGFRGVISLFLPMQNWWRSSFNNWFFAHACWDPNLDIKACIRKYCQDYYGKQASDVEEIFNLILTDLQPEPYRVQSSTTPARLLKVTTASKTILTRIDNLMNASPEKNIAVRLLRLRAYVEYSLLYEEALASRKPEIVIESPTTAGNILNRIWC